MSISKPSYQSLYIEMTFNGNFIASGTAFIVDSQKGPVLITNRHNVTGRNNITGIAISKHGHTPDEITIKHNKINNIGYHITKIEPLYNENLKPLWIEHPILGSKVDFVALPLTQLDGIDYYPYILTNNRSIIDSPSEIVSVVGFPFGITKAASLAIWATGFIATEIEIDYDNLPVFLIDCRAREGQSGSAVIAQRNGTAKMKGGGMRSFNKPLTIFLGIYSGRVNEESDLGFVWKVSAIKELVDSIV